MMIENFKKQLELFLEKFEKATEELSNLPKKEENSDLNENFNSQIKDNKIDEKEPIDDIEKMKDEIDFLKEEVSILSNEILHLAKVIEMQQTMVSKLYQANLKILSALNPNSEENDIFKKQSTIKKDYKPN